MEARSTFKRSFWLFENEDSGYELGQKPNGYIKTEERDGKGKLWLSVQNLKKAAGKYTYELILLRAAGSRFVMACMGILEDGNNGYSLETSFDAGNVAGTGVRLQDFDTAAVLVKSADKDAVRVICPLAAYKSVKAEWRSRISAGCSPSGRTAAIVSDIKSVPASTAEYKKIESKYVPAENKPSVNINESSRKMFEENLGADTAEGLTEAESNLNGPSENYEITDSDMREETNLREEVDLREEKSIPEESVKSDIPVHMANQDEAGNKPEYEKPRRPLNEDIKPQEAANQAFENVNTSCVYMNGGMCGGHLKEGVSNPCSGCRAYSNPPMQEKKESGLGNINKLKELLEANFEKCDPFNSNRSDYKWWKVANPVNLNNLLYECNIRSPLLFNPNVMMSHYKYRHLIIGIFTDRQTKNEYLVCGVPGMHMVDKRPFDDLCRWVQFEGSKPLYGAFGYWLVYIDPKTGRLITTR